MGMWGNVAVSFRYGKRRGGCAAVAHHNLLALCLQLSVAIFKGLRQLCLHNGSFAAAPMRVCACLWLMRHHLISRRGGRGSWPRVRPRSWPRVHPRSCRHSRESACLCGQICTRIGTCSLVRICTHTLALDTAHVTHCGAAFRG